VSATVRKKISFINNQKVKNFKYKLEKKTNKKRIKKEQKKNRNLGCY